MPLDLTPDERKFYRIFHPYAFARIAKIEAENTRLVHYTSAEAGLSIIQKQEVWMRKSSCMDDFTEVHHGFNCLRQACAGDVGQRLKAILDGMFAGFSTDFDSLFGGWSPTFFEHTYLTCVSEHDPAEDQHGRLSMWRAFGKAVRVALVFNNKPFFGSSDALKVYSSPVAYLSPEQFKLEFSELVDSIEANSGFLREQGSDEVKNHLFNAFRYAALCTKHPGFHEERELRIIYAPKMHASDRMIADVQTISGVPQPIYKIPLKNIPESGFVGVELPQLLDRVIIGPTQFPVAVAEAFEQALTKVNVSDAARKIFVSDIPLRQT